VSQPRSADGVPSSALAAQRAAVPALARWNRRVACLLIALVAIPAVLALALTGLRVTDAARSAGAYGRVARLAALGQQVAGLARAVADERSATATFISGGRPAAGLPALRRRYAITDARAAGVSRLVSRLGDGYPAQTRAGAAQVLASIAKLPGLRSQAAQRQASALAVITGYSAAAAGLFPVTDAIADQSGNATLITSVRALGALSRMIDHTSQQQAILGVALAQGRFAPGEFAALTTAQARQASDLASFRGSATPEESWALAETLARPLARRAQAVEARATAAGNGVLAPSLLALSPLARQQWSAGMSYTVGWMGHAEQQLGGWITAEAQALQRGAMRSAVVTGGAGLGALVLVVLGAVLAVRSMVRRLRRLEAAALDGAGAGPPSGTGAVEAGFLWRSHSLTERLLRLIDSAELNEDDPDRLAGLFEMDHVATRIWRNSDSALVLAGHEPPRPAEPLALVDVLRAAASEIEEYGRVVLDAQRGVRVRGSAATDTVHLLAELLDNATAFSRKTAQVIVSGHAVCGGGSLVTIADAGTGLSEQELILINGQLASPSPAEGAVPRRTGLAAVALLAARHGIAVTLSAAPGGGTTAEVYLPAALISLDAGPGGWRGRASEALLAGASAEAAAHGDATSTADARASGEATGRPEAFADTAEAWADGEATHRPEAFADTAEAWADGEATHRPEAFAGRAEAWAGGEATHRPEAFADRAEAWADGEATHRPEAFAGRAEAWADGEATHRPEAFAGRAEAWAGGEAWSSREAAGSAEAAGEEAVGEEAAARFADLPFSALRFASGPEPPVGPEEIGEPEAVSLMLSAPVPSPAPGTSSGVTGPGPVGAAPGDGPPIFESVRSGYPQAFGRGMLRFGGRAGQSPAGWPAGPPASWGERSDRAVTGPPAAGPLLAGRPVPSRLPRRTEQPGQVRGAAPDRAAPDQETRQAPPAEPAETTRSKLASFQRGSRRARAVARTNRGVKQPEQDG